MTTEELREHKDRIMGAPFDWQRTALHLDDLVETTIAALTERDQRIAELETALIECRDELDYYYQQEYPGDHPHFVKERDHLKANNPARLALEAKT